MAHKRKPEAEKPWVHLTDTDGHLFDQTNGLVDLGKDEPDRSHSERNRVRNQTEGGIAMLSANRPAG